MTDVVANEKDYHNDSESQQHVYERPKGIRGIYMHPVTQVRSAEVHSVLANMMIRCACLHLSALCVQVLLKLHSVVYNS